MKKTLMVLQRARERVDQGWCQGSYAQDSSGCEVGPHDEEAVCWCLTGALEVGLVSCYPPALRNGYEEELQILCAMLDIEPREGSPGMHLAVWNDEATRTREEVLTLLNEAIHSVAEEVAT